MKKINNVVIIGLGAIGSIYATRIYDYSHQCVKVLLDEARQKRYEEEGLVFNCKSYNFDYILESEQNFKADLIIIATKAKDFEVASGMIKNFVGEDTIILSLLNGVSSEKILIEKYGAKKVLYSYYIGHASIKTGNRIMFSGNNKIVFGAFENNETAEKVQQVKDFFDEVGINYEIPEDMQSAMWKKFVINIGINQTSAVFKADYEMLQQSEEARTFARELMQEAVLIAEKSGVKNSGKFIEEAFDLIDSMPPELKSSMLQDVEKGQETEVDIFAGEIVRLGNELNIATPKNQEVLEKLKNL